MKKNLMLAIILSMLAVASTGCALIEDIVDEFDSNSSVSDRDKNDKEDEDEDKKDSNSDETSDKKASLLDIFNFDKNKDEEDATEEITEELVVDDEDTTEPSTTILDSIDDNNPTEAERDVILAKDNVLYNEAGLKITYNDFEEKYGYLNFNMTFENSSDIPYEVQAWTVYINGQEADAIMSVTTEVDNTIEDEMKFDVETLKEAGINPDDIETIEVSFHIFDWDDRIDSVDTQLIKFNA